MGTGEEPVTVGEDERSEIKDAAHVRFRRAGDSQVATGDWQLMGVR